MSTQPARSNVSYLPRLFRRKPELPDGKAEIVALDIVYDALLPLSSAAQNRVIEHAVNLLNERARALNEYTFEG